MRIHLLATVTAVLSVLSGPRALADAAASSRSACASSSESAQDLRVSGRLVEAEAGFRTCAVATCPRAVREDCLQQLEELGRTIPTLLFVVTDDRGRALSNISLAIDGRAHGSLQQGGIVRVDPGEHTFQLAADGHAPTTETRLVREGLGHEVRVVLSPLKTGAATNGLRPAPADQHSKPIPTVSLALGGLGVVALGGFAYLGLRANADTRDLRSGCAPNCSQSEIDGVVTMARFADVSLITGVLALSVAAVIYWRSSLSQRAE